MHSRYRGVTLHRKTGKWQAAIKYNNHNYHLGLFASEEAAARAYDIAARQKFGVFAAVNFSDEEAA
jgi:AP2-like factor (ANT lineage)